GAQLGDDPGADELGSADDRDLEHGPPFRSSRNRPPRATGGADHAQPAPPSPSDERLAWSNKGFAFLDRRVIPSKLFFPGLEVQPAAVRPAERMGAPRAYGSAGTRRQRSSNAMLSRKACTRTIRPSSISRIHT